MEQKKQVAYFQWLRVIASLAVVLMHVEGIWWPAMGIQEEGWRVLTFWDSLVRWPVPVFLMITGAIFLPRKTELGTMLKRNIPRMAAAFCFWSAVCALYTWRTEPGTDLAAAFLGGHYHLWYLPFLCGVYLAVPFVQKIVTDAHLERQLLAVSLVIGVAVPWLADLTALIVPEWSGLAAIVKNNLHFTFFFDLLAVLLLGHVLDRRELTKGQRRALYGAGILGAALNFPLTLWASSRTGAPNAIFCAIGAPGTLCAAAAVFVFAKYRLTWLPRAVSWMADRSFGVYLCHALLIDMLADRGIHALAWDPSWSVPVLTAAVFALSLAVSALLRRLPVVGRYLV